MTGQIEINRAHTFYVSDNCLVHILVFSVFSWLMMRLSHNGLTLFKIITWVIVVGAVVLTLYIILEGRYYPVADQKEVIDIAASFLEKDFSALQEDGYLFYWPYQIGVVLYYYILSMYLGSGNILGFQLVNMVFIFASYVMLAKLLGVLMDGKGFKFEVLGVASLFIPYLFYSIFLYGNVIGFFEGIFSYYMMLCFIQEFKWSRLISGGISMALAVLLKQNCLIFLIAALIYLFGIWMDNIKDNKKIAYRALIFGFFMVVCCLTINCWKNQYLMKLNDGKKIEGVPMVTYIAMGLQDSKGAPGWYNGYHKNLYIENNCEYNNTKKAAMEDIANTVKKYPEDFTAAISFFVKKVASQWNNPTYSFLFMTAGREERVALNWFWDNKDLRKIYIGFVNIIQTWIFAGCFLYALFHAGEKEWKKVLLPLGLIGGFFFHIFWEASDIYATSYLVLILPLCAWGYRDWHTYLTHRKVPCKKVVPFIMGLIFLCLISRTDMFAKIFARNDDDGIFNVYTQDIVDQDQLADNFKR